ncbi:class I SAM-dependent methyltransferase [Cellulophaga sp. Hel_I_12]|uniref:class I SAM-dependent methyltransferase n=1 Tax=Cellulophaga sp. Hel_I_12 TaxID=1249972 RepID=UPI00064643C7|nr:class I SAM-dependent methyltransferase [Cellulophaga sp. Hel_I_12]
MSPQRKTQKSKKRWPTQAVMHQIYEKSMWGGAEFDFYSGDGSHSLALVNPYVEVVKNFLKGFEAPITVCDLGCGDFNVGHQLVSFAKEYFAIDIVDDLIERNKLVYKDQNLTFKTLDVCKDDLPKADVAIVRQVLQHLSNAEILEVTSKLRGYTYFIITEHIPSFAFTPNLDLVTGQGNRLKLKSGVVLTEKPFNFKPLRQETLLELPIDTKSVLKTILYQNF